MNESEKESVAGHPTANTVHPAGCRSTRATVPILSPVPRTVSSFDVRVLQGCRSSDKVIEIGGACDGTRASTVPAPAPAAWGNTSPTSQGPPETLSFDSIVGNATAKRTLFEHVVLPLKLSEEARNSLFGACAYGGPIINEKHVGRPK